VGFVAGLVSPKNPLVMSVRSSTGAVSSPSTNTVGPTNKTEKQCATFNNNAF
jgi:hypothetical protein